MPKRRVQNRNKKVRTNGLDRTARGLKPAKPKISESQRTVVADREKISPRRERSTLAQSQISTSNNAESIRTKRPPSPPRSDGPLKFKELGEEYESSPSYAAAGARTFGTSDGDLSSELLIQVIAALPRVELHDPDGNYALAALYDISPRDALEGMLAAQMVAVHHLAMDLVRRAAAPVQSSGGMERNGNLATKLLRTFIAQLETLDRHRGKGEQKINVEHMHIRDGAQGIVRPISHEGPLEAAAEDHGKANGSHAEPSKGMLEKWESAR
jgi:hypothetical protein